MNNTSIFNGFPVYYTQTNVGDTFSKSRCLSIKDFYRFMKRLHFDYFERDEFIQILIQKDMQRLTKFVSNWVKEQSKNKINPCIIVSLSPTIRKLQNINYLICYDITTRLLVDEIETIKHE